MAKNKPFWRFINKQATETSPESIELMIEGDIVSNDDVWIYEWLAMDCTSPNVFKDELKNYKGKEITVWIDSSGGDVFAAAGIFNALKEHSGKITAKVNKAMSAASVIAMAADETLMSPVGIMMIHNPLSEVKGYASDLRKRADVLDTVKETIMNAYCTKTKMPRNQVSDLMDEEAYMDANTAVKNGFADGVLYADNKDHKSIMNFAFNRLSIQNYTNESIDHLFALKNKTKEEDEIVPIQNATDLKTKIPAVHDEVYNSGIAAGKADGVKGERERLKAFDMLNGKVDADFLAKEKYEEGATAESVLFKAMQEGKMINAAYVAHAEADAVTANAVPGASSDDAKPDEVTGILNKVTSIAKRTLGIQEGGK